MLNKIKSFFEQNLQQPTSENKNIEQRLHLASAALMIEVAYSDSHISEQERTTLKQKLITQFELTEQSIDELITLAESEILDAHCSFEFIQLINKFFEAEEKFLLVKNMWAIAYADKKLDPYEEAMIRKLADLLYVPHSEFIRAKLAIQESL